MVNREMNEVDEGKIKKKKVEIVRGEKVKVIVMGESVVSYEVGIIRRGSIGNEKVKEVVEDEKREVKMDIVEEKEWKKMIGDG